MEIRCFQAADLSSVGKLWEECRKRGEILLRPFDADYFTRKFVDNGCFDRELMLLGFEADEPVGLIFGVRKHEFLNREDESNTPGFITLLLVAPEHRNKGIGSALLARLEDEFRRLGKKNLDVSFLSPINLDWLIPGTPGHGHNNMPGMDTDSMGYGFLTRKGYRTTVCEVAMYLNLSDYQKSDIVEEKRKALKEQGIIAGLYDPNEKCEWDGMCDRVGSEYWRKVLKDELSSPSPRPILAARTNGHIVGFTGPVDVEESGRGWFTGICTDPLYEQRGIATVLFNDLMGEFIKAGAQFSSLFTGTDNHAQRLYLRTGFRPARQFANMRKEL